MVVLRSYLLPVLEELSDHITETPEGFKVKGLDYELEVDEKQLSLTYKDQNVEISLSRYARTIMCYEIKNGARPELMRLLAASKTDVSREVIDRLEGDKTALTFTENLEDAVKLVGEHLKYRSKVHSCQK